MGGMDSEQIKAQARADEATRASSADDVYQRHAVDRTAHKHVFVSTGLGEEMDRCEVCGKRRGEPEDLKSPPRLVMTENLAAHVETLTAHGLDDEGVALFLSFMTGVQGEILASRNGLTISALVKQAFETSKAKGWYEKEDALLALLRKVEKDDLIPGMGVFSDAERATARQALADGCSKLPERLCLMVSEIAEALEEHRAGRAPTEIYYLVPGNVPPFRQPYTSDVLPSHKPEGIPIELSDVLIRVCDAAGRYGIDIENAIRIKLAYNSSRSHRHGGKVC